MKTDEGASALMASSVFVNNASDYTELFTKCNGNDAAQKAHLRKEYLRYAKVLHPDKYSELDLRKIAQDAFMKMQTFLADAEQAIKDGTYGQEKPKVIFETKNGKHTLGKKISTGDICDVYDSNSEIAGISYPSIVKITRSPIDNDLSTNEKKISKKLKNAKHSEELKPFVTKVIDSFSYSDGSIEHNINVIENPALGFIDLETLKNNYFPNGLDALHVAWIWRRVLLGIEFAGQNSIVHGALLPSNILIHPALHGVVLSDWSYAVDTALSSARIAAVVGSKKDWYPPEILAKEKPTTGTDIYMAAQSMIFLLGGDPIEKTFPKSVPIELQRYFKGCTVNSTYGRPNDAIVMLQEFDSLLESIGRPYHPRQFAALAI